MILSLHSCVGRAVWGRLLAVLRALRFPKPRPRAREEELFASISS